MKTIFLVSVSLIVVLVAPLWAKGPNYPPTPSELTDTEKAFILYLFEEEKLARDVYARMYSFHGAYIFNNISESEQRHMNSVANLISKYGIDDTVVNNEPGIYSNELIQNEYDLLLEKGAINLIAALEVGVEIELMDIEDIEKMLTQTTRADIERVLSNLLNGSYNHLDAFNNQLGFIPQ